MTALLIIRGADGFRILSDGAGYTPEDSRLVIRTPKVGLLSQFSGFTASRGMGGARVLFQFNAEFDNVATFDALVEQAGEMVRHAAQMLMGFHGNWPSFSIFFGGWSESRERFENYVVSSTDRGDAEVSVASTAREAFEVVAAPEYQFAPFPSDGPIDSLKLWTEWEQDGETHRGLDMAPWRLPMWIHAARLTEHEEGCGVGGFIQETIVQRGTALVRIVHRYADEIGEPLGPKPGETEQLQALCEARRVECGA